MPDGNRQRHMGAWLGVGVHPTPSALVKGFARAVVAEAANRKVRGESLRVLDACAGDGRLGHAVARRLAGLGYRVELTLVEVDFKPAATRSARYDVKHVRADFFSFEAEVRYDVVVSNPPYLALGRSRATSLGLAWANVLECGRNLYGLALAKCLSVCKPSGVMALLAPHGWLRNHQGAGLRMLVDESVESLDVFASRNRRLFPDVQQDVAVQVFRLRDERALSAKSKIRISYDRSDFIDLAFAAETESRPALAARVRVGLFVWNREKERLSRRATGIPVVYGGNISPTGLVDLNVPRYKDRRFAARARVPATYISRGPCLLVKRTMRGAPGAWRPDVAAMTNATEFVAENHVIVVELPAHLSKRDVLQLRDTLVGRLQCAHQHHGHPNVSVALVRRAVGCE